MGLIIGLNSFLADFMCNDTNIERNNVFQLLESEINNWYNIKLEYLVNI